MKEEEKKKKIIFVLYSALVRRKRAVYGLAFSSCCILGFDTDVCTRRLFAIILLPNT